MSLTRGSRADTFHSKALQILDLRTYIVYWYEEVVMSKGRDRTIFQGSDGLWTNKRNDAERATGRHKKQSEAVEEARQNLANQGGGELTIIGRDKKIRSKDTTPPGNDPRSVRDTEH